MDGGHHQSQSQSDAASRTFSSELPPASPLEDHPALSTVTTHHLLDFSFCTVTLISHFSVHTQIFAYF